MGKKITIQGKVHNVGYRLFLLEQADTMFIPCFDARNVKINNKEALIVSVDGEDSQLNEFIDFVNSNSPEKAVVKSIIVEDYAGKIRGIDKFRQSFDTIQLSKIVHSGLEISVDTKSIKEGITSIKEDTKSIKEGITSIKEDTKSIKEGITSIKEDTKFIKEDITSIKEDTKSIKEGITSIKGDTKYIQQIKDDTKEIKVNSYKTNQLLEEKFAKLENEIDKIKIALVKAGIEV